MIEPQKKRASFFVDGQNLFHSVKKAFRYQYPNYDVKKLAETICKLKEWELSGVNFYTGIPDPKISPRWHQFWTDKLATMGTRKIKIFTRRLKYSTTNENCSKPVLVGREKGIDVRLALDVTRMVFEDKCNVAVILSQDQDLSEVAKEVRYVSQREKRWVKIASAFPVSKEQDNHWGINKTDWIKINREMYDECIDPRDYKMIMKREKDQR